MQQCLIARGAGVIRRALLLAESCQTKLRIIIQQVCRGFGFMKGLVFESFINHVEDKFGLEVADQMIEQSDVPNRGAYTAVGTYDANELVAMLTALSSLVQREVPALLRDFGHDLFFVLGESYPELVKSSQDTFALMSVVDEYIHREVKKLYPDADLPGFTHEYLEPDVLRVCYKSERGFSDLAYGLMAGCADYFKENIEIQMERSTEGPCQETLFVLTRHRQNDD